MTKKEMANSIVMPKSGCKISKVVKKRNDEKTIYKEIFLFSIPLLKNQALIIKKKGFKNSEGCMLRLLILIHLFAPLTS